jgi:hypothetical protein
MADPRKTVEPLLRVFKLESIIGGRLEVKMKIANTSGAGSFMEPVNSESPVRFHALQRTPGFNPAGGGKIFFQDLRGADPFISGGRILFCGRGFLPDSGYGKTKYESKDEER